MVVLGAHKLAVVEGEVGVVGEHRRCIVVGRVEAVGLMHCRQNMDLLASRRRHCMRSLDYVGLLENRRLM